jgi:hypothetical protein
MTIPERTAVASHIAIIALCAVVAFAVIELVNTLDRTLDGVNVALATVNRPGTGTLAEVNKAAVKTGDAIVTTQMQELAVVKQISPVLDSLATVAPHVNQTMTALSGTATAASTSLQDVSDHLTPVLDAAKLTTLDSDAAIKGLFPVESDTDRLVKDFDVQVTSPAVGRALNGLADTSQQAALATKQLAGIATDLHKATSDAIKPQPWWRKALGYGNLGVNIACLATHSCPF